MNFDVLITVIVAISTYQTGMCYPNDRIEVDHEAQKNDIAKAMDVNWGRSMVSFKPRMSKIEKIEKYTLGLKLPDRKRRITNKWSGNDDRVNLKVAGNVKEPVQNATTSLSRLKKKEINPSNIDTQPKQLDRRLKSIMDSFKIKAIVTTPPTTINNWGYHNKFIQPYNYFNWDATLLPESFLTSGLSQSLFKNTRRTIPPKKLKLLKALLKRFRSRTTTDSSMVLYNLAGRLAMSTTTSLEDSRNVSLRKGSHRTNDQFLSLKEFDHIFTPSTEKYDGVPDVVEDGRLSLRNRSFSLDYDTSIPKIINQITEIYKSVTENYKSKLSNARSNDQKIIVGTSLNSLVAKNLTKFLTKLKNSDHESLHATPITLTLNEDNDDILFSNNTMILPIPIIGKYMRKDFKNSELSNIGPITPEDRKIHVNMIDIKTSKEVFNDLNNCSLFPYVLRGPNIMQSYLNGPVISVVTNTTEKQPSREDHTKSKVMARPVLKKNVGKHSKVNKVLNNNNSPDRNIAKLLHPMNIKPLMYLKVPYRDYLHWDSEVLKTFRGIDNTLLPCLSNSKTIKIPNCNSILPNISPPNSRSNQRIRKISGNNIVFSESSINRLNETKHLFNGTDEFLAIPVEVLSNEFIHLSPNHTDFKEDKSVKDQMYSDQIKMNLEKYVHDREDCCDSCDAKHTRPRGHHKSLSTSIGTHMDSKHVTEYYKCPKCARMDGTEKAYFQEDLYTYEDIMPETFQTDIQKWKCTCKKIFQDTERLRKQTEKRFHINHSVRMPVSNSTGEESTLKIYDEDEVEEDYFIITTESALFEKHKDNNKLESSEESNFVTHRPAEIRWDCCRNTCSCKRKNPSVTGPSRQDIIVSIMCGTSDCTRCTKCTTNEEMDSLSFFPEKFKTVVYLDEIKKETCAPLEVTAPSPDDGGPTICTKHETPSVCTHPAPPTVTIRADCPYCLKTKKRRCTCACFCGSKSQYFGKKIALFSTKSRSRGTKKIDFLDIFPHLDQNSFTLKPKKVETTTLPNKKSTHQFLKVIHASHVGTSSTNIEPMGTYYTVTDIDLANYLSKTTFYDASNETENKDETDLDYWLLGSTSDENISSITDADNSVSSTECETDHPKTSEQTYETTCSNIKSSTLRRLCFCSRNKKKGKNKKNKHHDSLKETHDDYNKIKSKNVGKYKVYGLDSFEMTDGLNRVTPLDENINPSYKEVTWFHLETEAPNSLDDDIESMTTGYAEMDHYRTETEPLLNDASPAFKIITQDYEELTQPSTVTTPHSLLSPWEKLTLSTKTARIPNHHEIRAFLSSNSFRKSRIKKKKKQLKASALSTSPLVTLNTSEKAHSSHKKVLLPTKCLKATKQRNNLINQVSYEANFNPSGEKPVEITRVITEGMESNEPMESKPISLPKEIVKSSDIASVKIVFGRNNRNVKKNKKESFNGTKKFFSFETEL